MDTQSPNNAPQRNVKLPNELIIKIIEQSMTDTFNTPSTTSREAVDKSITCCGAVVRLVHALPRFHAVTKKFCTQHREATEQQLLEFERSWDRRWHLATCRNWTTPTGRLEKTGDIPCRSCEGKQRDQKNYMEAMWRMRRTELGIEDRAKAAMSDDIAHLKMLQGNRDGR